MNETFFEFEFEFEMDRVTNAMFEEFYNSLCREPAPMTQKYKLPKCTNGPKMQMSSLI